MLSQELEENEAASKREQIFIIDTNAFYELLGWIKGLSKALKKGELNGKRIEGRIIVPEPVLDSEVNKKYFGLLKQKEESNLNKSQKNLFRKVKRAKLFLDKELGSKNPVWQIQKVTDEIMGAMMQMKADPGFYKMKNPPNDNDLLIVATVMAKIYYRKRPNWVTVVSWDGGVLRALKKCKVSLKGGNPKDLFPSYWKWRKLMVRLGLKKKDLKKGD